MVRPIGQPDGGERRERPLAPAGGGCAVVDHRKLDVLLRGEAGEEVEPLEDEAEPAPSEDRAAVARQPPAEIDRSAPFNASTTTSPNRYVLTRPGTSIAATPTVIGTLPVPSPAVWRFPRPSSPATPR